MVTNIFKNHLSDARTKLGLTQRQVACIFDLKSPSRISGLEHGRVMPSARECAACQVLYKRSFAELWPRLDLETEAEIDLNIRRLIVRLQNTLVRSERKRARIKVICKTLAIIVDGLPEDIAEII